ncbi:MAG: zinc-binding dehydrogenase [Spirochaetaceae bacterium]
MKTKAVRLHGANDLRLDEFDLPPLKEDEVLARVISDSICMSTYKATVQGEAHKRVPQGIGERPVIVGHETAGVIEKVGAKWSGRYQEGMRFSIQPAINYKPLLGGLGGPGYSYEYMGGDATHVIIPNEVMEADCLLPYRGEAFYLASLAEPMSTIIGTFHAHYHTEKFNYVHKMGIAEGGALAMLAGAGPMGLGAVDYAIHGDRKPRLLVVSDINEKRLERARTLIPAEEAARQGVELHYVNTGAVEDPVAALSSYTDGGFDDVIVFAPVAQVIEQGDKILGYDGCLNFFAGPTDHGMEARINMYDVHYSSHHIIGTSGGGTEDMREALELMAGGRINPSAMITHIGGLNAVAETTQHLPEIPGGKKLIYTGIELELTAIDELAKKGENDPFLAELNELVERHNGLWSPEAEAHLLANARPI